MVLALRALRGLREKLLRNPPKLAKSNRGFYYSLFTIYYSLSDASISRPSPPHSPNRHPARRPNWCWHYLGLRISNPVQFAGRISDRNDQARAVSVGCRRTVLVSERIDERRGSSGSRCRHMGRMGDRGADGEVRSGRG